MARRGGGGSSFDEHSVILEYRPMGRVVKVSAIDPVTLTEVSIVGDARQPQEHLNRAAINKLRYVIAKKSGTSDDDPSGSTFA